MLISEALSHGRPCVDSSFIPLLIKHSKGSFQKYKRPACLQDAKSFSLGDLPSTSPERGLGIQLSQQNRYYSRDVSPADNLLDCVEKLLWKLLWTSRSELWCQEVASSNTFGAFWGKWPSK